MRHLYERDDVGPVTIVVAFPYDQPLLDIPVKTFRSGHSPVSAGWGIAICITHVAGHLLPDCGLELRSFVRDNGVGGSVMFDPFFYDGVGNLSGTYMS